LSVAAGLQAQEAPATAERAPVRLSLGEALARALKDNLALGRARAEVTAAEAQKKAALALVLPRLGATASSTRNSDEVSFGSDQDRRTILPRNDWNLRLTLNQPIFAGFREKRAYDQSKLGIESAREATRATEDTVLLQVAADYLAVFQGDALIDVEGKNLELARRRQRQATDFFEAGESTRVDVLKAETAIKAAERRLIAARQLREAAAGRLRVDLALDGAAGDLEVQEPGTVTPPPPDEATLVHRALESHPEIAQALRAREIASLEVKKQVGAYLPVITAEAGYVRQKTTFPKDEYGFARVNISVPLFQAGEVGARTAVARQRERQAVLALEEAQRRVREDVHTALLDLQAATTGLGLAEEQLAAAQAEYDQVFDLYRSQEATAVDLDSAETALADARRAVVGSRLDRKLAELTVWYAAGALKSAVLEEVRP
jgi:outer membrane protein